MQGVELKTSTGNVHVAGHNFVDESGYNIAEQLGNRLPVNDVFKLGLDAEGKLTIEHADNAKGGEVAHQIRPEFLEQARADFFDSTKPRQLIGGMVEITGGKVPVYVNEGVLMYDPVNQLAVVGSYDKTQPDGLRINYYGTPDNLIAYDTDEVPGVKLHTSTGEVGISDNGFVDEAQHLLYGSTLVERPTVHDVYQLVLNEDGTTFHVEKAFRGKGGDEDTPPTKGGGVVEAADTSTASTQQ
jgi:hypothetical protein